MRAITSRTSYGIARVGRHHAGELCRIDGRRLRLDDRPCGAGGGGRVATMSRTIDSA